jgi:hypothetical protein
MSDTEQETAGDWYERCLSAIYYAADHDCTHNMHLIKGSGKPVPTLQALRTQIDTLIQNLEDEKDDQVVGMDFVEAMELLMLSCHQRGLRTLTVFFHSVKTFHERWDGVNKAKRPDGRPSFPTLNDE